MILNRRYFLKITGFGIAAGFVSVQGCTNMLSKRRPNIIFILADDLGWAELGCYGNKFNETPNLDRLASQGMRFTQAYAAAPVCSPYRAALMTGQYPARVGITDYLRPNSDVHLPLEYTTLAEMFKSSGYMTGMIGKWHLSGYKSRGARNETPPGQHGFDEVMISEKTGIGSGSYFYPYDKVDPEIPKILPGEREYLTDRHNVEAVKFIERNKDKPFFLYKSHYAVHTKLDGKPDWVEYFEGKPGCGRGPDASMNNPHLAAQLKVVDEGVGMIMDKLEELSIADNTIIIFTSDNGGESRVTSNAPLRAGKSTLYEGGIREPLIIKWPGVVDAGSICQTATMNIDFYPTFAEMAAGDRTGVQQMDGVSMLPLLRGKDIGSRPLYWHYPLVKPHFLGGRSSGAIRLGNWKLIEFFDGRTYELFDMASDPGETTDLKDRYPEKVRELHNRLMKWREDVGAEYPEGQPPARI